MNLTPKALRYLDYLGVLDIMVSKKMGAECKRIEIFDLYSAAKVGELSFEGPNGDGIGKEKRKRFFARRVMRSQLQEALLEAVAKQEGAKIVWGKKTTQIEDSRVGEGVQLIFEDGESMKCDLLLGCDGIHSAVRTLLIDPGRQPKYTGVAVVMATSMIRTDTQLKWETTGLTSSRRGSFMASYFEPAKKEQYMAVVTEVAEVGGREGWRAKGSDQNTIKADIMERFECKTMPELAEMVEDASDWTLYPTYMLPPKGNWISRPGQSCILLGDAAHAVSDPSEYSVHKLRC